LFFTRGNSESGIWHIGCSELCVSCRERKRRGLWRNLAHRYCDKTSRRCYCHAVGLINIQCNTAEVDFKWFWRWYITFRTTGFLDFVHRPVF
jgi:hypothetical protein